MFYLYYMCYILLYKDYYMITYFIYCCLYIAYNAIFYVLNKSCF